MDELNEDKGERWRWDECSNSQVCLSTASVYGYSKIQAQGTGTSTDFVRLSILLNPIGEQLNSCQAPGPGALLASKAGTAISIVQLVFFSLYFFSLPYLVVSRWSALD